jgi:hypothetical protein
MADQGPRKPPSIPSWQQNWQSSAKEADPSSQQPTTPTSEVPKSPTIKEAQDLLEDDSLQEASREKKVQFLREKGVSADNVDKLLPAELAPSSPADESAELKTIHDTTQTPTKRESTASPTPSIPPEASPTPSSSPQLSSAPSKRDVPPIITYPEFLLKPQKPPPLVTFERLANAAYVLAGISTLTWGTSKFLIQPMLESLTEARQSLAETAKSDLETLNSKLESTVSHVPYIPTLQQKAAQEREKELGLAAAEEDSDSDPTELFHRDIATQTSPHPSRTLSLSSTSSNMNPSSNSRDPTTSQASRLRSLHSTLSSLLSSQTTQFSESRLQTTLSDFQTTLDKLETSYNPFAINYSSNPFQQAPGLSTTDSKTGAKPVPEKTSEATKFKNEIRALKGAFLSSRNFPTARPAQPFTLPTR